MTKERAIEIIRKRECNSEHYEACEMAIQALEQETKTGHWILHEHNGIGHIECSECSRFYLEAHLLTNRYCPNCGCHMVEPQESEDKE